MYDKTCFFGHIKMIKIIIHIFPHELEEYARVLCKLNEGVENLKSKEVIIHSCLNLNSNICIVNSPEDSSNYFTRINDQSKLKVDGSVNISSNIKGVNEHRRLCFNKASDGDMIILLDTDLHFHGKLLSEIITHGENLRNETDYFILTPQYIRLWDTSWDPLVNDRYVHEPLGYYKSINPEQIVENSHGNIEVTKLNTFKWAGGWFTCISGNLAKLISIPQSFIGYGPDDTFMMECCKYLKKKRAWDVSQYLLRGYVVCEDRKLQVEHKKHLHNFKNFRTKCNLKFTNELSFFKKRILNDIYNNEV